VRSLAKKVEPCEKVAEILDALKEGSEEKKWIVSEKQEEGG
jgi:hypothetical protein